MKNLIYLLIFLTTPGFGQMMHQAWQVGFRNDVSAFQETPEGHWLLGGSTGFPNPVLSQGYIARIDGATGQLIHQKKLYLLERSAVTALIPQPDGRLIAGGTMDGCDYGYSGFVALLDTALDVIWMAHKDDIFQTNSVVHVNSLVQMPDGDILAVGDGQAHLFNILTGLKIGSTDLPEYGHRAALASDSSFVWIAGSNGISALYRDFSLQTVIPHSGTGQFYKEIVAAPNGRFFALRENNTLITGDLNGLAASVQLDYTVYNIAVDGPDILLCGRKNDLSRIEKRDANLNMIFGYNLSYPDQICSRIRPDGTNIALAGVELHGPAPRPYPGSGADSRNFWVHTIPSTGPDVLPPTDAGIAEIVVYSNPVAQPTNNIWFPWSVTGGSFSVRVRNMGSGTLQSVQVLASGYGNMIPFLCPAQAFISKSFTDLNLQPGADTLLFIGDVSAPFVTTADAKRWKLCLWTAAPNGKLDIDHENDYQCLQFVLVSPANTPTKQLDFNLSDRNSGQQIENQAPEQHLALYPNPAQDVLYLKVPGEAPGMCRIFNAAGQLMGAQKPTAEQDVYRIDTGALPAGFYLLQTECGWGRFFKY